MTTLIAFVALAQHSVPAQRIVVRHAVFSERIRVALAEAWRAFVG